MYDYTIDLYPHTLLSNTISRISIVGPIALYYLRASYYTKRIKFTLLEWKFTFFHFSKKWFSIYKIVSKTKVPAYKWMLSGLYIYRVTKPNLYEKKRKVMNGNCYWTSLHREIHFNFRKKNHQRGWKFGIYCPK